MTSSRYIRGMKTFVMLGVALLVMQCSEPSISDDTVEHPDTLSISDEPAMNERGEYVDESGRPWAAKNGKFWEDGESSWLYGGESEGMHFDITNLTLDPEQFHYGIGREEFPALLDPLFSSTDEADQWFNNEDRFLFLEYGETKRAYSVADLTVHEVVNDVVEGRPIMAAYCILADLGAIYDRTIDEQVYTFGLSGYTYYDPEVWDGLDGFVMWDRETESLWWPLTGLAVSGEMEGTEMRIMDEQYWSDTTWEYIKTEHPDTDVLIPGQDFERPTSWPPGDQ